MGIVTRTCDVKGGIVRKLSRPSKSNIPSFLAPAGEKDGVMFKCMLLLLERKVKGKGACGATQDSGEADIQFQRRDDAHEHDGHLTSSPCFSDARRILW